MKRFPESVSHPRLVNNIIYSIRKVEKLTDGSIPDKLVEDICLCNEKLNYINLNRFVNLAHLFLTHNQLTNLDLSGLDKLKFIDINDNPITNIILPDHDIVIVASLDFMGFGNSGHQIDCGQFRQFLNEKRAKRIKAASQ